MTRDISSNISVAASLIPAVAAATATGVAIDRRGFRSASAVFTSGAVLGAGDFTPSLQESDDGSTGWTAVAPTDIVGTFPDIIAASSVVEVGYSGSKRFLRAVATKNGGTSVALSAVIVLGDSLLAPAS